jgi:DnaA family protein
MYSQIPLPIGIFDHFSFETFVPGQNREALENLKKSIADGPGNYFYLWGRAGTGKTHILQAACGYASRYQIKPGYIPLSDYGQLAPEILNGLENLDLICIDDIDSVSGMPDWERGLFNLFNTLAESRKQLIVTSASSPSGIEISLPDLKSRLASGLTYHLKKLADEERLLALKERAGQRGFELTDEVLDYLSRRVARDMHTLFDWLDRLDEASMVSKRKLTVALVKELLNKT